MTSGIPYWVAALYGVLAAAAILIGGGLVGPARRRVRAIEGLFAALGAGFLVALGGLGALPEALQGVASPWPLLALSAAALGGMVWLHRLGHHDQGASAQHGERAGHEHEHAHEPGFEVSLYDARLAVWGLALHSMLDGVAVSASLAAGKRELGLFVAFFVLLHKLPEGAAAAALTYAGGGETRTARNAVWIVASASLCGAFAIFAVLPVLHYALAITAGVTIGVGLGIATHLRKHGSTRAWLGMSAGAGLFAITEWLLHG